MTGNTGKIKQILRISALLLLLLLTACSAGNGGGWTGAGGDGVRRESAAWIVELGEELGAKQLFVVAGVGKTAAYVSMHEKDVRGYWYELMTTPGFIRMAASGESDNSPPNTVSVYALNASNGVADDPGFVLQYKSVMAEGYSVSAGVAIPEACMRTVMQNLKEDCVAVVDELNSLSGETYQSLFGTIGPFFANSYIRKEVVEVDGRQGVCCDGKNYWVSGSATLAKYDMDWNLVEINRNPFKDFEKKVNHIGDIDVYRNELYIGAEYFNGSTGSNIQIAVFDADTLEMKRTFPFEEESGQTECSGIAVNPDTKTVWMCSWAEGESGRYLYRYDLNSGDYLGKVEMVTPPLMIQGIAYYDGSFYMTSDDGSSEMNEPDHLYRTTVEYGKDTCVVVPERIFDDVTRQGEIEGLSFDKEKKQLLLLYNRGVRVVNGRSQGFYYGYHREISEVFIYDIE